MKVPIETSNLREQIYEILRDMILGRQILPGEKIIEEELGKKIGVSRTPIRETLCRLENEGIVEIIPRRGAFLKKYSRQKVGEVFDMREVLEGLVVRLVTVREDTVLANRLRRVLGRVHEMSDQVENLIEFTRADVEFHRLLLHACRNEMLQSAMEVINTHLQIIRARTVVIPGRARRTVEEHYEILAAVESQDPAAAEVLMRRHIGSVRKHFFDAMDFAA